MDPDGRNQSEDDQTFDISQFGPPRTGSPFEPARLGSLFGWGRAKKPTAAAVEPPAEPPTVAEPESGYEAVSPAEPVKPVIVEPVVAGSAYSAVDENEVEIPLEAELEQEQPNESEPSLMNEFENESKDETQITTEPVVIDETAEVDAPHEQTNRDPELPVELTATFEPDEPVLESETESEIESDIQVETEIESEPEVQVEAEIESEIEVAEGSHELLAAVGAMDMPESNGLVLTSVATGQSADDGDEIDDGDDEIVSEEEPQADVIQMASYVEHDEDTDKGTNDGVDDSGAEVIDLDTDLETTEFQADVIDLAAAEIDDVTAESEETEADVIDLEFEDSNVINLAAQQNGAAVSSFPMPEAEIAADDVEAELEDDSLEAEFESDIELEVQPDIDAETELRSIEAVSEPGGFVAEDDLGADTESELGPEHDLDIEPDEEVEIEVALEDDSDLESETETQVDIDLELDDVDLDLEIEIEIDTDRESDTDAELESDTEVDLEAEHLASEDLNDTDEPFGVEDDTPAIPLYSVGAAIELLDTASDEADEVLDSADAGVIDLDGEAGVDEQPAVDTQSGLQNEPVDSETETVDSETELVDSETETVDSETETVGSEPGHRDETSDAEQVSSDETSDAEVDADIDEPEIMAKTPFGLVPQQFSEANTDVTTNEEPEVPGMPSLEDLRTMALDLDDIDAILERLDSDPDSLDLDVPPVEQTLDLSLSE